MGNCLPYGDAGQRRVDLAWALEQAEAKGWKLVPREPTPEMSHEDSFDEEHFDAHRKDDSAAIWRLMWDAAP